jgi:hypothetical protein
MTKNQDNNNSVNAFPRLGHGDSIRDAEQVSQQRSSRAQPAATTSQ